MRRTFASKKETVVRTWRMWHSEKFSNSYDSPNVTSAIKLNILWECRQYDRDEISVYILIPKT